MSNIRTLVDFEGDLAQFLSAYRYQPELTAKLDALGEALFGQAVLNEIVLWKVDCFASFDDRIIRGINAVRSLKLGEHRQTEELLEMLLGMRGVDLPMASTILRFRNPDVFQIIDRRAYRVLFRVALRSYRSTPVVRKIATYFSFLDKLISVASELDQKFRFMDLILYQFDKTENQNIPLNRT